MNSSIPRSWSILLQTVSGASRSLFFLILLTALSQAITDENANGVSDLWEQQHNNGDLFPTFDPNADPDSDGWTNAQEAAAGTDPTDPNPPNGFIRPETTHVPAFYGEENGQPVLLTPEAFTITWPVITGKQYTLQFSLDLSAGSWSPVGNPFIAGNAATYGLPIAEAEKCFWRVAVTDVDTDNDTLTNAEEAELGSDPQDNDSDDDGLEDGVEFSNGTVLTSADTDQDGTLDGQDIAPSDDTASFTIGLVPRYALFPITNATPTPDWPSPLQINNNGTVLYANGTWKGDVWRPLTLEVSGILIYASARGINDSDQILGIGYDDAASSFPSYFAGLACYWPTLTDLPSVVEIGGQTRNRAGNIDNGTTARDLFENRLSPGPVLANDGGFYSPVNQLKADQSEWIFQRHSRWKLPSNGQPITETSAAAILRYSTGSDSTGVELQWGFDPARTDGSTTAGGSIVGAVTPPVLPFTPTNVITQPGGMVTAMPSASTDNVSAQAYVQNAWKPCVTFANASDIAADGTAIGRKGSISTAPLIINGKSTSIFQYAPEVPDRWKDSSMKLLDTTPGGWVLAERGVWPLLGVSLPEYAVLLPIRADGVDPALSVPPLVPPADPPEYIYGGVDHTSMTAHSGKGKVPEIWIMAPNGGASKSVRFQSPLNSTCKLTLESDADVGYTPSELNSDDMVVNVKGEKTDTADFTAKLKLGATLDSLSIPLKIKTMKKRTVKVAVHKVFGIDKYGNQTVPTHFPAMNDLDTYLNEVFGRQANTFFQCTAYDEKGPAGTGIDFDLGISDGWIRYAIDDLEVKELIVNPKSVGGSNATANIDIWVFGGGVRIADANKSYLGYQIGAEFEGKILIDGDLTGEQGTANELSAMLLYLFAHEIGHVMVGRGHAQDGTCKSDLVWKPTFEGVDYQRDSRNHTRLMTAGLPLNLCSSCKQLIKKEWDLMEAWLKKEEERIGRSL